MKRLIVTKLWEITVIDVQKTAPLFFSENCGLCVLEVNIIPSHWSKEGQSKLTQKRAFLVGSNHEFVSNHFLLPMWGNQCAILILKEESFGRITSEMLFHDLLNLRRVDIVISCYRIRNEKWTIWEQIIHKGGKAQYVDNLVKLDKIEKYSDEQHLLETFLIVL